MYKCAFQCFLIFGNHACMRTLTSPQRRKIPASCVCGSVSSLCHMYLKGQEKHTARELSGYKVLYCFMWETRNPAHSCSTESTLVKGSAKSEVQTRWCTQRTGYMAGVCLPGERGSGWLERHMDTTSSES